VIHFYDRCGDFFAACRGLPCRLRESGLLTLLCGTARNDLPSAVGQRQRWPRRSTWRRRRLMKGSTFIRKLEHSLKTGQGISLNQSSRIDIPNPRRSARTRVDARYLVHYRIFICIFVFLFRYLLFLLCKVRITGRATLGTKRNNAVTASEARSACQRPSQMFTFFHTLNDRPSPSPQPPAQDDCEQIKDLPHSQPLIPHHSSKLLSLFSDFGQRRSALAAKAQH
jgi:hypothetical protein